MADSYATVGAALIGAGIALVGLMVSKESKISEFRQQWIDGLRNDVSTLIGTSVAIRLRPLENATLSTLSLQLYEMEQRIALRFKRDSTESTALLEAVRGLSRVSINDGRDSEVTDYLFRVRNATHTILEAEWKRVKRGEPADRQTLLFTKAISVVLGGALAVWAVVMALMTLVVSVPTLFKG